MSGIPGRIDRRRWLLAAGAGLLAVTARAPAFYGAARAGGSPASTPALPPAAAGERWVLSWPTPNPAYPAGLPPEAYIQPTQAGTVESGLYGCTRNSGTRFHEGIDLLAIQRDGRGEALDPITALAAGRVVHVSQRPGESGYGRYVVLEHPAAVPAVYSLYAHLSAVAAGIEPGAEVARGDRLGTMGRSAGGYVIPPERAHLHLEIGLRLADDFETWYRAQDFGSPNRHGRWNGMNLAGFDPLDFCNQLRAGTVRQPIDYLRSRPTSVRVRVHRRGVPPFARRYPALVAAEIPLAGAAGWEVDFDRHGVPTALRPLDGLPVRRSGGNYEVLEVATGAEAPASCFDLLARARRGRREPGPDLVATLDKIWL